MRHYASVYSGDDAKRITRNARRSISRLIKNLQSYESSMIIGKRLYTFGWSDSFRLLIEGLEDCPLVYRNLILNSAQAVYLRCPLAVPLYLLTLEKMLAGRLIDVEQLKITIDRLVTDRKRVSSKNARAVWRDTIQDNFTYETFDELSIAVDRTGALGTIEVRSGRYSNVEVYEGVSVAAKIAPAFQSRIANFIHLDDCKIVIVDGAILDISELNKLLVYANESKTRLVIFASQFSDDILNTLIINWSTGRLKVVPMIFDNALNNINQPGDLATVTGSKLISKDCEYSLTLLEEEDLATIKSITANNTMEKCEIVLDSAGLSRTFSLRSEIQKKRDTEKIEDIKNIFSDRLARLTSRKTVITIKCDIEEYGIVKDRISDLFSFIKCCANESVVSGEQIYELIKQDDTRDLPAFLPAFSAKIAIFKAIADFEQINKIGALILIDY